MKSTKMTVRTTTRFRPLVAESELYQRLAERHGHYCPMSTLGVRLGEEALRHLTRLPQIDLDLCYLARTCAADGIRLVFESAGYKQDFSIDPLGQHRLRCRLAGDKELSLQLSAEAMQLAAGYRDLDEAEKPKRLELLRTIAGERLVTLLEGSID